MQQCHRQVQATLHAAGKLPCRLPGTVLQARQLQCPVGRLLQSLASQPCHATEEQQVFPGGQSIIDGQLLGNIAQHEPGLGIGGTSPVAQAYRACIRFQQACNHGNAGGFACSVGAEKSQGFPGQQLQIQIVHCFQLPVGFVQFTDFQKCLLHGFLHCPRSFLSA